MLVASNFGWSSQGDGEVLAFLHAFWLSQIELTACYGYYKAVSEII